VPARAMSTNTRNDRSDPPRLRGQQERKVAFHIGKGCLFSWLLHIHDFAYPISPRRGWSRLQGLGAINGVGRVLDWRAIHDLTPAASSGGLLWLAAQIRLDLILGY
jgi:hypothetical protein